MTMKRTDLFKIALCLIIAAVLCSCGGNGGMRVISSKITGVITSINGSEITVSADREIPPEPKDPADASPSGPIEKEPDGQGDPRDGFYVDDANGEIPSQASPEKEPDGQGDPGAPMADNADGGFVTLKITVFGNTGIFEDADGRPVGNAIGLLDLSVGDKITVYTDQDGNIAYIVRHSGGAGK